MLYTISLPVNASPFVVWLVPKSKLIIVFNFETPVSLLNHVMFLAFDGIPCMNFMKTVSLSKAYSGTVPIFTLLVASMLKAKNVPTEERETHQWETLL